MFVIRFTIYDGSGAASFVGPCHAIKMLAAACSRHPTTLNELLEYTRPFDADFVDAVRAGLAIFDEHNTPEHPEAFHQLLATRPSAQLPPFRVLDDATRQASLEPATTGLILFNLPERRIIQVQNSYADLERAGRGRVRLGGRPTSMLYHYRLPAEWRIVP
ncbi:MAG: hypothetical protein QJR03_15615 [Sphaerobacter sp.]|nr:hypothetical protein [Sphaerobacter sp.]